jgi:predicted  nucleic acid-binding Zn-ribbon protein
MPAKPKAKTLAAAEKRVIKNEISTLKKAVRRITSDCLKEADRIDRERKHLDRQYTRIAKAFNRETNAANRRLAILEGRLLS